MGIAAERDGSALYVTSYSGSSVLKLPLGSAGLSAVAAVVAGSGNSGFVDGAGTLASFYRPFGLALDPAGTSLLVADTWNNALRALSIGTKRVAPWVGDGYGAGGNGRWRDGAGTSASLDGPTGIAVSPSSGHIFISDSWNHRIRRVGPSLAVTTLAGDGYGAQSGDGRWVDGIGTAASFNYPMHLVLSPTSGDVLVADCYSHCLRRVSSSGVVSTLAGNPITGAGFANGVGTAARFNSPFGLAIDAQGSSLYCADTSNHVIRLLSLATLEVTTLAGTAGSTGHMDGLARQGLFNYPRGLFLSSSGTSLFVADNGNDAIRTVSLLGAGAQSPSASPSTLASASSTTTRTSTGTSTGTPSGTRSPTSTPSSTRSATSTASLSPTASITLGASPSRTPSTSLSPSPAAWQWRAASPSPTPYAVYVFSLSLKFSNVGEIAFTSSGTLATS